MNTQKKFQEKRKIRKRISQARTKIKETRVKIGKNVRHRVRQVNEKRKELIERLKTKRVKTADIFTLLNATFGLLCIFFSIKNQMIPAMIMLVLAVGCDILDGRIARRQNNTTELGKELDSLADIVSFGIAPVIFAFMQNSSNLAIVVYIFFLCCGIIRLARFNIQQTHIYFYGMPITANGYIIPLIFLIHPSSLWWPLIMLPLGILMICRFKVKKIQ